MYAKKVAVLGSTGSVGTQALDAIKELGYEVVLLAAKSSADLVAGQAMEFKPRKILIEDTSAASRCADLLSNVCWDMEIICDKSAILEEIRNTEADIIVHSVAGLSGIEYALEAADSGKRLAMANKEAIIACGDIINEHLKSSGGVMIPVDSEHSAIFQCLEHEKSAKRILLTASGGPFFGYTENMLKSVTVERALAHPTWKMGAKITVDSATLMNKGFEIMEAVRLFGVEEKQVEVLVHRQSIIHSMVEFTDNTVKAVLSEPDMRYCIRYAMTYPDRAELMTEGLDFTRIGSLTFESPDYNTFPLLGIAREAINKKGSAPVSLIAADEAAVAAFLDKKIGFTDISSIVVEMMDKIDIIYDVDEYNILEIADYVKAATWEIINKSYKGCELY